MVVGGVERSGLVVGPVRRILLGIVVGSWFWGRTWELAMEQMMLTRRMKMIEPPRRKHGDSPRRMRPLEFPIRGHPCPSVVSNSFVVPIKNAIEPRMGADNTDKKFNLRLSAFICGSISSVPEGKRGRDQYMKKTY
jgi:hypothetical protein